MRQAEAGAEVARRMLDQLREEFRSAGHGELRRVSVELGLTPDHLATMINRGYMDVGVFFAALERLGVDPALFVFGALPASGSGEPPAGDPVETQIILERWRKRERERWRKREKRAPAQEAGKERR